MRYPAHTMASSDFSSTYMLGVRLVAFPSRPGTQVRAWMRPPRFRAKNVSTCTRSPTARGSSHPSHSPWDDVAFSFSELDPFHSSILGRWSPPERFTLALAGRRASLGVVVVG